MALGAAAASLACVAIDTWYFRRDSSAEAVSPSLVLTPLNLLRYNLASENLKEHGLHPRYLHLLVNWPMLFGVGIVAVGTAVRSAWRQRKARQTRLQSGLTPRKSGSSVIQQTRADTSWLQCIFGHSFCRPLHSRRSRIKSHDS